MIHIYNYYIYTVRSVPTEFIIDIIDTQHRHVSNELHVPNNYFWICLVSISNFRLCVCVHIYLYLYSIGIAYKMIFVDFSFKRRYPQPHHGRGLHVWDRAVTIYMPRPAMTFDNCFSLDLYGRTGDLLS